jgi:hypothetical protein
MGKTDKKSLFRLHSEETFHQDPIQAGVRKYDDTGVDRQLRQFLYEAAQPEFSVEVALSSRRSVVPRGPYRWSWSDNVAPQGTFPFSTRNLDKIFSKMNRNL